MSTRNLLVELFVEELPPKALKALGTAFAELLADNLKTQGLMTADSIVTSFASPRRLAAHITAVADKASDKAGTEINARQYRLRCHWTTHSGIVEKIIRLGARCFGRIQT